MCAGVGGGLQAGEAAELFGHRNSMHDKVYQHRKVRLGTWVPFARPTCYAHAATLLRTREGLSDRGDGPRRAPPRGFLWPHRLRLQQPSMPLPP
eukprot:2554875-Rhodomonas_salina.2